MADVLVLNGEIIWDNENILIVKDEDDIKQQAYLASTCDLGESIFYNKYGSTIFKYIGKPYNDSIKSLVEAATREVLLGVNGISEILEISYRPILDKNNNIIDYYIIAKYLLENGNIVTDTYNFNI